MAVENAASKSDNSRNAQEWRSIEQVDVNSLPSTNLILANKKGFPFWKEPGTSFPTIRQCGRCRAALKPRAAVPVLLSVAGAVDSMPFPVSCMKCLKIVAARQPYILIGNVKTFEEYRILCKQYSAACDLYSRIYPNFRSEDNAVSDNPGHITKENSRSYVPREHQYQPWPSSLSASETIEKLHEITSHVPHSLRPSLECVKLQLQHRLRNGGAGDSESEASGKESTMSFFDFIANTVHGVRLVVSNKAGDSRTRLSTKPLGMRTFKTVQEFSVAARNSHEFVDIANSTKIAEEYYSSLLYPNESSFTIRQRRQDPAPGTDLQRLAFLRETAAAGHSQVEQFSSLFDDLSRRNYAQKTKRPARKDDGIELESLYQGPSEQDHAVSQRLLSLSAAAHNAVNSQIDRVGTGWPLVKVTPNIIFSSLLLCIIALIGIGFVQSLTFVSQPALPAHNSTYPLDMAAHPSDANCFNRVPYGLYVGDVESYDEEGCRELVLGNATAVAAMYLNSGLLDSNSSCLGCKFQPPLFGVNSQGRCFASVGKTGKGLSVKFQPAPIPDVEAYNEMQSSLGQQVHGILDAPTAQCSFPLSGIFNTSGTEFAFQAFSIQQEQRTRSECSIIQPTNVACINMASNWLFGMYELFPVYPTWATPVSPDSQQPVGPASVQECAALLCISGPKQLSDEKTSWGLYRPQQKRPDGTIAKAQCLSVPPLPQLDPTFWKADLEAGVPRNGHCGVSSSHTGFRMYNIHTRMAIPVAMGVIIGVVSLLVAVSAFLAVRPEFGHLVRSSNIGFQLCGILRGGFPVGILGERAFMGGYSLGIMPLTILLSGLVVSLGGIFTWFPHSLMFGPTFPILNVIIISVLCFSESFKVKCDMMQRLNDMERLASMPLLPAGVSNLGTAADAARFVCARRGSNGAKQVLLIPMIATASAMAFFFVITYVSKVVNNTLFPCTTQVPAWLLSDQEQLEEGISGSKQVRTTSMSYNFGVGYVQAYFLAYSFVVCAFWIWRIGEAVAAAQIDPLNRWLRIASGLIGGIPAYSDPESSGLGFAIPLAKQNVVAQAKAILMTLGFACRGYIDSCWSLTSIHVSAVSLGMIVTLLSIMIRIMIKPEISASECSLAFLLCLLMIFFVYLFMVLLRANRAREVVQSAVHRLVNTALQDSNCDSSDKAWFSDFDDNTAAMLQPLTLLGLEVSLLKLQGLTVGIGGIATVIGSRLSVARIEPDTFCPPNFAGSL